MALIFIALRRWMVEKDAADRAISQSQGETSIGIKQRQQA